MLAHGGSGGCFGGGWCGWMDIVDEFSCGIAPPDLALGYRQAGRLGRAAGFMTASLRASGVAARVTPHTTDDAPSLWGQRAGPCLLFTAIFLSFRALRGRPTPRRLRALGFGR